MWPLDLPAREVLKLPGETMIPWAVFDWQWYLRTYPDVSADEPAAVLEYYLEIGQRQGHSPNRMFDESWHRQMYPQIAERVAAGGDWRSAFDAYCRRGALDRSAHWLFDELAYRDRYPDLTNEVLAEFGLFNGYDHYLRHGIEEDRIGHLLFDPHIYLSHFDSSDVAAIRENGVFQHYLNRIESGEPELRTSIYFDPAWYLKRYPDVAATIAAKRWKCALHHYLCNDTSTEFDPLESFSESWYLRRDPGLRAVVTARSFRNGYAHFLRFGAKEKRAPTAFIDLAWYATQPPVRADLEQGRAADAYAHWLAIGAAAGLPSARPETETITVGQAQYLFHQAAVAQLPIAGRHGYRFECQAEPVVSVVMVVRNGFAAAMATIASLRSNTVSDIELIIIDCASGDETSAIGQYVPGAKVLRFESDIGWSRAADTGRQLAGAQTVLFLCSEGRIAPGSVDRARARLTADESIGAVGGMILQGLGTIAQAGGILWNTGGTHDYKRGVSPLEPEANFVRAVDFCAPAFLLVRTALLSQLDGFDHECATGYETVDLCLRIAEAGFSVVYDPSVMLAVGDAGPARGSPSEHFLHKHAAALAERQAPGGLPQVFARHAGAKPHRILFIEDTVPLRRIGSGFVRANDLIQVMASLGHAVTVFPVNGCDHDLTRVFGDMPDSVEVMHTLSLDNLAAFLTARPGYYDMVWVARTHNLARVRPILARSVAAGTLKARIVADTEAITPHREAMQAELAGEQYDLPSAMQAIVTDAAICQQAVAVTEAEAGTLRSLGFPHVSVIGHMIEPNPTTRPFAQRAGMLFVGAVHQADSPNLDSLVWFVDAVLPLIEAELKWETRLTIAGYVAPGIDMSRFDHHPRVTLRGPVADLTPLYNAHRVFVAPTRYAAGAPYKVLEAASRGVPVVATDVLRGELNWNPGRELLVAGSGDPVRFAAHVVAVYRDATLWQSIRERALHRLQQENGRAEFTRAVASVIAPQTSVTPLK
ncbi:glycosyltransferase [Acidisphaera sp. S103]|uniref:glycosyltransferase n=1 Tax=Acidisphaera sp. S103 TaxID=1747223 RepID=UPI00131ACE5C|nr:glycosyltransferase [Acidisphaera sp. S103]